jgi:ABC-type branched-subunit amino acid transport system permease subunit
VTLSTALTILFFGIAYGTILYLISVGLSVTMGLMRFVNLAHGVFAMFGGYVTVSLMNQAGASFAVALPASFLAMAALGLMLERGLYRHLYGASELRQVLFSIGLIYVAVALARMVWGSLDQPMLLPELLRGRTEIFGQALPRYRLFIVAAGAVVIAGLWLLFDRSLIGARIRAAVDDTAMAQAVGIDTGRLFAATFALGSGLAGLGGAIGADILPIAPGYPLQYVVLFLIVVSLGGAGSVKGPFLAALGIGLGDAATKYLLPEAGNLFVIFAVFLLLLWRPHGIMEAGTESPPPAVVTEAPVRQRRGVHPAEALPWLVALAVYWLAPHYSHLATQIIVMVLFALSLDLLVGFGGIVSLGHAGLFGVGAYAAGLLAVAGVTDPLVTALAAMAAAALVGLVSGALLLRTQGLALLMLSMAAALLLHEVANKASRWTGGDDGLQGIAFSPLFGLFPFDFRGQTAFFYSLGVLFLAFLAVRLVTKSPFGWSLRGIRDNPARMAALGCPVYRRRLQAYVLASALAGLAGALQAQTTAFVALHSLSFELSGDVLIMLILGGAGRLYGAFVGVPVFMVAQDLLAKQDPANWHLGQGAMLLLLTFAAPGGLLALASRLSDRLTGREGK